MGPFDMAIVPGVEFRDRHSLLTGLDDLTTHSGAALKFMPGVSLRRKGAVRQCQGTALADWTVPGPDHKELMVIHADKDSPRANDKN